MTQQNAVHPLPVALVTGGSRGLGRALTISLVRRGWHVVIDARDPVPLTKLVAQIESRHAVTAVPGDVRDPRHRLRLAAALAEAGGLDLLVNNASVLGPSPQPALAEYPLEQIGRVFDVNVFGPLALTQFALPRMAIYACTFLIRNISISFTSLACSAEVSRIDSRINRVCRASASGMPSVSTR